LSRGHPSSLLRFRRAHPDSLRLCLEQIFRLHRSVPGQASHVQATGLHGQPRWAECHLSYQVSNYGCGTASGLCRPLGHMAIILLVDNDPLQAIQRKSLLERRFDDVQRVRDAAEALCLVEQPQFVENLGLVVCGLDMRGIGGPAFVAELQTRLPRLPVLVLGSATESAGDYAGEHVRYLPRPIANETILSAANQLLAEHAKETV
jgi:CheY-like chemotaxis protein